MRRWRGIVRRSAIALAITVSAVATLDCYGHQCDANNGWFPSDASNAPQGRMLDDNTFETNGIDEPWIIYPGNIHLRVNYPMDLGRPMSSIDAFVGISEQPNQGDASNWTVAAGALAEFSLSDSKGFTVVNATCQTYSARFVVHFPPRSATNSNGATRVDSGLDATQDSAAPDAGADAD